ncbi:MAG: hypothetical protein WCI76_02820 [bacterium]
MRKKYFWHILILLFILTLAFFVLPKFFGSPSSDKDGKTKVVKVVTEVVKPLDTVAYDKKMLELANNPPDPIVYENIKTVTVGKDGKSITTTKKVPLDPQPVRTHLWPVKNVYPIAPPLLPFNRIIAYYGNLYSNQMGVLGEYPEAEMLAKLEAEVKKWEVTDPSTPVIPALHYIAVVAQGAAGKDGKYRTRMPDSQIDKVLAIAAKIPPHAGGNAIVFLDIQVGFSDLQSEVPALEKYLKLPNVYLGVDPEFSMKTGVRPGKVVGTLDAADINFAIDYLSKIVKENNLPPKILVVHRYTQKMVTNYAAIKPTPEVQVVMNMDGWGGQTKKIGTYKNFIYPEPVQFSGFKLFYKNDVLDPGTVLFEPKDLLKLNPIPSYIQYQ